MVKITKKKPQKEKTISKTVKKTKVKPVNGVKSKKIPNNSKKKIPKKIPVVQQENESSDENEQVSDVEQPENTEFSNEEEIESDALIASDNESDLGDAEEHKKALGRLQQTDPEFYKFLKENDKKLLQFNLSDDDEKSEEETAEQSDEEDLHKPSTGDLQVASDESDFEDEDQEKVSVRLVTLKMIKQWQADIQTDTSNKTMSQVVLAFNAALKRVEASNSEEVEEAAYKVDGPAVFNAIIQLCVLELGPAIRRLLGMKKGSKQAPHKCKKFVKVKTILKSYFTDLTKLLGSVSSANILNVLLKHLHYMAPLIVSFPNTTKLLLKRLVNLWGSGEESVRVVAFLCILRITHNQQQSYLDSVLKSMYLTYVKNSKFVSTNTLPAINFMRRSLVELFALDLNVSYQHVFLYIRQLAINLRNAITDNKKENVQVVYNWQFVNSLRLWGNLLSVTCNKPQLQPLVYPFVQVCLGTIKLVPTAQYYPLRFHVTQILMDLSKETGVFIPILPFLIEVLSNFDFNKKHQKVSMKPLQFTTALRMSKSQMSENGFKDQLIESLYGQFLEYLASQSHSIAYPELVLFTKHSIKSFLKTCQIDKYKRQMHQLQEKINENSKMLESERQKLNVNLKETKKIDAWETTLKNNGTPLSTYFENWNKVRNIRRSKLETKNDQIGEYNLPVLKKKNPKKLETRADNGKVELFPSSSDESDAEIANGTSAKSKRGKRAGKNVQKKFKSKRVESRNEEVVLEDGGDIVQDINDW